MSEPTDVSAESELQDPAVLQDAPQAQESVPADPYADQSPTDVSPQPPAAEPMVAPQPQESPQTLPAASPPGVAQQTAEPQTAPPDPNLPLPQVSMQEPAVPLAQPAVAEQQQPASAPPTASSPAPGRRDPAVMMEAPQDPGAAFLNRFGQQGQQGQLATGPNEMILMGLGQIMDAQARIIEMLRGGARF